MEATETKTVLDSEPARPQEPDQEASGLRFEDPYWDDAFCAWWDPTLRTCC